MRRVVKSLVASRARRVGVHPGRSACEMSTLGVVRSPSIWRHLSKNQQWTKVSGVTSALPLSASQRRTLFVQTEKTPNPDSLKFLPGVPVLESGTADFATAMSAVSSPLAKKLFRNDGVKRIFLTTDYITITKTEDADWETLKPSLFADIMEFFTSGETAVGDTPMHSDTTIQPGDSDTVQMIKELLETRIRPSVQDDGGDITYLGFVDGVVFVQMKGSCSGCPSSGVTLKSGIERMMQHWIPDVNNVVAVESEEEFTKLTGQLPAGSPEAIAAALAAHAAKSSESSDTPAAPSS